MSVQHIRSDAEFTKLMRDCSNALLLVDFFAEWCGPCKMIAPFVESLAARHRQLHVAKVDVDQCRGTAQACGVQAMPTFHIYLRGNKVGEMRGADTSGLQRLVEQHLPNAPSASFSGQGNVLGSAPSTSSPLNTLTSSNTATSPTITSPTITSPTTTSNNNDKDSNVNSEVLATLLSMGFPEDASRHAAAHSTDIESAVELVVQFSDANADAPAPKVISEEERQAALARVELRRKEMAEHRAAEEKRLAQEREKKRVEEGKKLMETKEKLAEVSRERELEKKKWEMEEDRKRKERVKKQIEEDKMERAARRNQASAASASPASTTSAAAPAVSPASKESTKVYESCVIQVKDENGKTMQSTFSPGDSLRVVREWVVAETGRRDARLAQTFPRKVYSEAELDHVTLQEAKLVPRGALLIM